ncbi:MAG: hypothetical protein ACOH1V_13165 [Stenotrophomonas sp.]
MRHLSPARPGQGCGWRQITGIAAMAAVLAFAVLVFVLQCLRSDLDWTQATLSLYLHGPGGLSLRVAYCVLAAAIAGLGLAVYLDLQGRARCGFPL